MIASDLDDHARPQVGHGHEIMANRFPVGRVGDALSVEFSGFVIRTESIELVHEMHLEAMHTVGTVFLVPAKRPTKRTERLEYRGKAKWARVPTLVREQFSVRLTPGQLMAIMRTRNGGTVAARLRALIRISLDGPIWPQFVDGAADEGAEAWVQIRVSPELRAELHNYQQAVGCRDLSAAVRSLVTSALAVEGRE